MKYLIQPSMLKGKIYIPSSKSHTLRAILFASLANGESVITEPLKSPDTDAMIQACRQLGSQIEWQGSSLHVKGLNGKLERGNFTIDAGNSGQVLRFVGAIAALGCTPIHFTGDASIQNNRPIQPLLKGLNQLGVKAYSSSKSGYAPFTVQGKIQPGNATISGEDSQPVSGLLIASAFCSGPVELTVTEAGEKPWIGLTLDWFNRLSIRYEERDRQWYRLEGNAQYTGFNYTVPGDFSSAAFAIIAALITHSEVVLENIDMSDSQGDKAVITLLKERGAAIEIDEIKRECSVKKGSSFQGGVIDVNDFIDALPILAVLGCFAESKTVLTNAQIARKKECDRLAAITENLRLMEAHIEEEPDQLTIYPSRLKGSFALKSYDDHRMAMALTVAALAAEGESSINNCGCVAKSYPSFFQDFQKLGAKVSLQ